MCSQSKGQPILSRETIENAFFFFRIMHLFQLRNTLAFCNTPVINQDIDLKLGVCVHYPKSNPYYQGRQFKMDFFFLCNCAPFFD